MTSPARTMVQAYGKLAFALIGLCVQTPLSASDGGAKGAAATVDMVESEDDRPALKIEASYTADYLVNARGGLKRGGAYIDDAQAAVTINGDKAMGWKGATLMASALYNNRTTFSDRFVGDQQVLSNIDTDGALRLYELWLEQDFGGVRAKAGLIDLNSEFDVNETGALFMGSSHGVGPDFSQIGENGPSIFPVTGLAAVAEAELSPKLLLRAGLFEGRPGSVPHPRRTRLALERGEGGLAVAEVEFKPDGDSRLLVGARRFSKHRITDQPQGQAQPAQFGGYVLFEGPLAQVGKSTTVRGFARYGYADAAVHDIGHYVGAGMVASGPLLGGEGQEETIGLSVGVIRNTAAYRRAQFDAGAASDRGEASVELTYRIQATPWLAVQPVAHYIINPGMNPDLKNAVVCGVRFGLGWERMWP